MEAAMNRWFFLMLLSGVSSLAAEEWTALFDGKTMAGWQLVHEGYSWAVRDGSLVALKEPRILEDLVSAEDYLDFELELEFKLEAGGNSGIKYRIGRSVQMVLDSTSGPYLGGQRVEKIELKPGQRGLVYNRGLEFQLLDDARHPDGAKGEDRRMGALYRMATPAKFTQIAPGTWSRARLVVKGSTIEHWVNGELVLRKDFEDKLPQMYRSAAPISLQNHGDSVVEFRQIQVRRISH
jgi:hypothetical protein